MRLCLLDIFILLCQVLRLYIAHQLSVHTVTGAMFQISQTLADTNQQSQRTTDAADHDGIISQTVATGSDDSFYHDDIVMGLTYSQLSQLFNSRRHHYGQVNEENTIT